MTHAVAIVPAYNRADTVGATVAALRTVPDVLDVIVVDDGSADHTAAVAAAAGARVIEFARNRGKGAAVAAGVAASGAPEAYLLIDADVGSRAALAGELLEPVAQGQADMAIAVLGPPSRPSGFGFVKAFAAHIVRAQTGLTLAEPLSGQRAVRGSLLRSVELAGRFGLEIGLTLDVAARGATIIEVEVAFSHMPSGRDVRGISHRARIGRDVYRAAASRIGAPRAAFHLLASLGSRAQVQGRRLRSLRLPWLRNAASRLPLARWRRRASRLGAGLPQRLRSLRRTRRRRPSDES